MKRVFSLILTFALIFCLFANYNAPIVSAVDRKGTVVTEDTSLNVRGGPGKNYDKIGSVAKGATVTIVDEAKDSDGSIWYKIVYDISHGYVLSKYIKLNEPEPEYKPDADFEKYLTSQGFPESYKPFLRTLHAKYPNWVFVADKIKPTWQESLDEESVLGRNLVAGSRPDSWKSTEPGAYNEETGKWVELDSGGWVAASRTAIAYFLDPRNYLNESDIFIFASHHYSKEEQTLAGLKAMVKNSYLGNEFPEDTHETYSDVLIDAAEASLVNPYALASALIVEQGVKGQGKSISGTVPGYEGYYNFFNVRAYASKGYNAIQYGLLYAQGSGSYNRPWDSRYKSIVGGAIHYGTNYANLGQDTLYYKKFNVTNESSGLFKHQYMTNIEGAELEASWLIKAYKNDLSGAYTFNIPVYKNMPETPCAKPADEGNSDNYLKSLSVEGYSITPSFVSTQQNYELVLPADCNSIKISAVARDSKAVVSGIGEISVPKSMTITISVKASGGEVRKYTIAIAKETPILRGDPSGDGKITITDLAVTKKHILGKQTLAGDKFTAADANKDGKVTITDLALMKKHILGKTQIK